MVFEEHDYEMNLLKSFHHEGFKYFVYKHRNHFLEREMTKIPLSFVEMKIFSSHNWYFGRYHKAYRWVENTIEILNDILEETHIVKTITLTDEDIHNMPDEMRYFVESREIRTTLCFVPICCY